MIQSLRNLSYGERSERFGKFSLRCKRLRSDMIEVFKMICGIEKVNLRKLFCIDNRRTTKHSLYIKIRRDKLKYWTIFSPREH